MPVYNRIYKRDDPSQMSALTDYLQKLSDAAIARDAAAAEHARLINEQNTAAAEAHANKMAEINLVISRM